MNPGSQGATDTVGRAAGVTIRSRTPGQLRKREGGDLISSFPPVSRFPLAKACLCGVRFHTLRGTPALWAAVRKPWHPAMGWQSTLGQKWQERQPRGTVPLTQCSPWVTTQQEAVLQPKSDMLEVTRENTCHWRASNAENHPANSHEGAVSGPGGRCSHVYWRRLPARSFAGDVGPCSLHTSPSQRFCTGSQGTSLFWPAHHHF